MDSTNSWNWQQGAIYNCTRNGHNCSAIYDVVSNQKKEIDWSIYGITPDGCKSIALEMERSHWCRPTITIQCLTLHGKEE